MAIGRPAVPADASPDRWGDGGAADKSCECPSCGYQTSGRPGVPCREMKCPRCGATMLREIGEMRCLVPPRFRMGRWS